MGPLEQERQRPLFLGRQRRLDLWAELQTRLSAVFREQAMLLPLQRVVLCVQAELLPLVELPLPAEPLRLLNPVQKEPSTKLLIWLVVLSKRVELVGRRWLLAGLFQQRP